MAGLRGGLRMRNMERGAAAVRTAFAALAGCSTAKYAIDDGREIDETRLANIRSCGQGGRARVPAIVGSATLHDPECETQWELPFDVATPYNRSSDEGVVWVRGLGVDERLTVVSAADICALKPRDKLMAAAARTSGGSNEPHDRLADQRDHGNLFVVALSEGRSQRVTPAAVCRGRVRLAPPSLPRVQDDHREMSVNMLEGIDSAPSDLCHGHAADTVQGARGRTFGRSK